MMVGARGGEGCCMVVRKWLGTYFLLPRYEWSVRMYEYELRFILIGWMPGMGWDGMDQNCKFIQIIKMMIFKIVPDFAKHHIY